MSKTLMCVAEGRSGNWEAHCLDLDISVTGTSFNEVYSLLNEAVDSYIEDARAEAPEQMKRLLNRRVPTSVRFGVLLRLIKHTLWNSGRENGESANFTPTLPCVTWQEVLEILEEYGFTLHRHGATSHRRYRRVDSSGTVFYVDLSPHRWGDTIPNGTLGSIIRQSGLDRRLFRR